MRLGSLSIAAAILALSSSAAAQSTTDPPPVEVTDPPPAAVRTIEPAATRSLHAGRLSIAPDVAYSFTPASLSRIGVGGELDYYFTERFAIGASGRYWLANGDTPAAASGPLQQTAWSSAVDFTFVLFSPKPDLAFLPEVFVRASAGAIATRPVSPDPNASVPFETKVAFGAGVGLRHFWTSFFATSLEMSDTIYLDRRDPAAVDDPDSDDPRVVTNKLQLALAASFWFPTI